MPSEFKENDSIIKKKQWEQGKYNNRKINYKENAKKISATMQGITIDEWNGFVRIRKYSTEFFKKRDYIKKRDNFTCQECGKIGGILDVHHIDFNKNNNNLNNLITLCHSCHSKVRNNKLYKNCYRLIIKLSGGK